nr:hypothetical protein [Bacteroidales bacterium]
MKTNSTFFKLKKNLLGVLFFMLATFLVMPVYSQTTVTIGTGTGNTNWVPVYTGTTSTYAYSYSQQIYTAAEITAGGGTSGQSITQIAFYVASGATISGNKTWVIYLGNTSTSTFSGTSAWITTANLTQVFTGTFNSGSSTGWVTVTLGTPFTWTGSNLVVAVDENSSTYGNTYYNYTSMGLNNYYVLR